MTYFPTMEPTETVPFDCGHCGRGVEGIVVYTSAKYSAPGAVVCPGCREVTAISGHHQFFPPRKVASSVKHLPPDIALAWQEARMAHAATAYTPAEMMCRKILMHIAVDLKLGKPGEPFDSYIEALNAAGYFPPNIREKVDAMKTRGNRANHKIPASVAHQSKAALSLTEYMLRTVYEVPK